jgi:hypothetical protein
MRDGTVGETFSFCKARSGRKELEREDSFREKPKFYKKNFCEAKTRCDRFLTDLLLLLSHSNRTQTKTSEKQTQR